MTFVATSGDDVGVGGGETSSELVRVDVAAHVASSGSGEGESKQEDKGGAHDRHGVGG